MKTQKKRETTTPLPEDFDVALNEQDRMLNERVHPRPRPSLRSQIVLGLKLLLTAGTIGLVVWFLDQMVSGS